MKYLDRAAEISALGLGRLGIEALVPPRRLAEPARYGMTASGSLIRRIPRPAGSRRLRRPMWRTRTGGPRWWAATRRWPGF